jgi:DNA-binding NarL/FixJ family response regulator
MHPEDQFGVRAIKAGAAGYIVKESAPDVLVEALRRAMSGRKFITPALAEQMAAEMNEDSRRPRHETLSDREYEVVRLMAAGKPVADVARELSLSVKTVSTYRTRILNKLKLTTTAGIIRYALKNGLSE